MTNHNIFTSFISFLAFKCLKDGKKNFCDDYFNEVHQWFEEATDLTRDIEQLKADLLGLRFLSEIDGDYHFSETYILYYFSAFYLKDYIELPEIRDFIGEIASKLWVEDYANVMLFLTHLSKDRHIAHCVTSSARNIFNEVLPTRIEDDALAIYKRLGTESPFNLPNDGESTPESRREASREVANEVILPETIFVGDDRTSSFEEISIIGKFNAAVKTVHILGQMLKNFPANFSPAEKVNIINECIDLGLRALTIYFNIVEAEERETVASFSRMLGSHSRSDGGETSEEQVKTMIFRLVNLVAFGITKRISYSIGSTELAKSYNKVFYADISTARKLVQISLELDHRGNFPEQMIIEVAMQWKDRNPFAFGLLQSLVARHFRLFHIGFAIRQRMCALLNVSFKKISTIPSGRKIVGQ